MSVLEHFISDCNYCVCWSSLLSDHTGRSDVKCAFEKHSLQSQLKKYIIFNNCSRKICE